MRKSFMKRIKVTRNGKMVRRQMGVNHFRTRKSTKSIRNKRNSFQLDHPAKEIMKNSLRGEIS